MRWFIPSESGDLRLFPHPSRVDQSVLRVRDVTLVEVDIVKGLLAYGEAQGWNGRRTPVTVGKGRDYTFLAPVSAVGAYLAGVVAGPGALSVERVVLRDDEVILRPVATKVATEVATEVKTELTLPPEPEPEPEPHEPESEPEVTDRVTVKRPTLCCPVPNPGPLKRASEVLKRFCTRRQWESWMTQGYLEARGHLSGHHYRIFHRAHPEAHRLGYITYDLDEQKSLHGYLWSVPPAEEVLTFKLFIENAEPYVRNRASGFAKWFDSLGLDPRVYGDLSAGTADAALLSGFAQGFKITAGIM